MTSLLERIGIELPIVQAGTGGGTAAHELAAAVSEAGGLGTIGLLDPATLVREIAAARRLTAKPIAVNLLPDRAVRGRLARPSAPGRRERCDRALAARRFARPGRGADAQPHLGAARLAPAALLVSRAAALQRPGVPIFGPASPLVGVADRLVDASPLYAGTSVERISDVRPAAELTLELAG